MISFEKFFESAKQKEMGHIIHHCADSKNVFNIWRYSIAGRKATKQQKWPLPVIAKKLNTTCEELLKQQIRPTEWQHVYVDDMGEYSLIRVYFYDIKQFQIRR